VLPGRKFHFQPILASDSWLLFSEAAFVLPQFSYNRKRLNVVRRPNRQHQERGLMSEMRIAWAITGAGHDLNGCVELLVRYASIDLFLSRAAEEVLAMYGLDARLNASAARIYRETNASSPLVSRLFGGVYRVLVIAPATSNSVAKFVCGISDSLVTNLFAQAGKSRVPVIVYPTDLAPEMDSIGPRGEKLKIYPRAIDLENTKKLHTFGGVEVAADVAELEHCLTGRLNVMNAESGAN
jgi:dihydromethanopterin reductase (acceptor)